MHYIWIEHIDPILSQIPDYYKSAALILHPFVEMPEHFIQYPTTEQQMQYGKPVRWETICQLCHFKRKEDVLLALLSDSDALLEPYARPDLVEQLHKYLPKNIFFPTSDETSPLLWPAFLKLLIKSNSKKLYWSSPIIQQSSVLPLDFVEPELFVNLPEQELLVSNETMSIVWLSRFDSFVTTYLSNTALNVPLLKSLALETIICDENTPLWFWVKKDTL
ncbi:DUF2711 domain-containing protein [Solibacillus sp. MA9]|uniref:DUF2711 domain-containing protein n=1 Tax=Solibacillus palustris TaxID=2908203 RepID=A0ABS9UE22_9BACL|nr:DUF2711 family protein [Solibacillus sp. MA9]MCH7322577.1 DUF2711 domain-containing protein [Solibacillus sp. MA9]